MIVATVSEKNTVNLWRLNVATGELKQLTFGQIEEEVSSCTPDGKWVVYLGYSATDNWGHIFKLSTDGGEPVELTRHPSERQRWLAAQLPSSTGNARAVRFFGTQLLTVRIDLDG